MTSDARSLFPRTEEWGRRGQGHDRMQQVLVDPVWEDLKAAGAKPDLDVIRNLFAGTTGSQPFHMWIIEGNMKRLKPDPEIDTGHPLLDLAVRSGLAFIDATFQGDHPKYGATKHAKDSHDGFPPVIIAVVDALGAWGVHERAARLLQADDAS